MAYVARQESATWDEANRIYASYRSWTHADFGLNPEHPPLVKLLATAPLLAMQLKIPALENRCFKMEAFLGGKDFVFLNDANAIIFRSRMGPALLTVLLALATALAALGRAQEARSALEKAVVLAKTVEPEFQEGKAARLEQYLRKLGE